MRQDTRRRLAAVHGHVGGAGPKLMAGAAKVDITKLGASADGATRGKPFSAHALSAVSLTLSVALMGGAANRCGDP